MLINRRFVRYASALSLIACAGAPLHAQRLGIIAGGTFSNVRNSDDLSFDNRTGTIFGLSLQLPVGASFDVQPEFLFLNKGAKFNRPTAAAGGGSFRLDYLEVPVLLRYDFSRGVVAPHVYAGPSIGFNVGCAVEFRGTNNSSGANTDCNEDDFKPKTLDYGVTVGGGVDFNLGGIGATAGARYGIGLADIRNDNSTEFKSRVNNGVLSLYVGVLFGSLKK
ncbi:MAG: porin family protein [Gemmatimonadaceae bacterium]